jgi:hypothetical protein
MRRLAMGLAGVVLLIALLPSQAGAGKQPDGPAVSIVHGLGTTPDTNFVDVYIREAGSDGTFILVIAGNDDDFGFSAIFNAGNLPPGDYDVLLCNAATSPIEDINGCSDNDTSAVNGNFGNTVTVADTEQIVLFAGWSDIGRPTVIAFGVDVSCVEAGQGRATAANAAYANPITVTAGGSPVVENVARGSSQSVVVPAGSYDVNISNDQIVDIDTTIEVAALQNTITYLTGNPVTTKVAYTLITQTLPLEQCAAPPSSATTTPAVQAATQPKFTG